jgi:hypothetical protein
VEAKLAVLADYAGVSKDNRLNILGIFEDINARAFPVTLPHIYAVVSSEADPTEHGKKLPIRVALLDEDEASEVLALEGLAEVGQPRDSFERVTVNQVVALNFVRFEHPGSYRFSFAVEDEEIASIPLQVNRIE